MPPTGRPPWDLGRLSATGRHFLLEPESRSGIVRELQQRLQQEQKIRCEHQLQLRSGNNAAEQQQPDEKEQEQQEEQKKWQQDEHQSDKLEFHAAKKSLETSAGNDIIMTAPVAPPPSPPSPPPPSPPSPPPPPPPQPKNLYNGGIRLATKPIQEFKAMSKPTSVTNSDRVPRLSSQILFEEVDKARSSKLLDGDESAPKTPGLSSQKSSHEIAQGVTAQPEQLADHESAVAKIRSHDSRTPQQHLQATFEEVNVRQSKLLDANKAAANADDRNSRLSAQELLEEVKVRQSKLLAGDQTVTRQDRTSRLSTREIMEEAKTQHSKKYLTGETVQTSRASEIRQAKAPTEVQHPSAGQDSDLRSARAAEAPPLQRIPTHYIAGSSRVLQNESMKKRSSLRDVSLDAASSKTSLTEPDSTEAEADSGRRLASSRQTSDSTSGTRRFGSHRAASPAAGESGEEDFWNERITQVGSLRLVDSPIKIFPAPSVMTDDFVNTTDKITQQGSYRSASSATSPCLMCLMRSLQDSGLLGSCWRTALLELEEAFAIKAVADAAVAGAEEPTPSQRSQQPYQQPYHQSYQQPYQQSYSEQSQLQAWPPTAPQQLSVANASKWQALERLCSLRNSLRTCSHACD